ncbi:enoyl-CoA hydratase/carnithine racemase [Amycolatopsis bartoniae]|uniref:Crotonase n=1 Tax=Amycolatopsis bartoniae TaxID=941986 RepID=A0A8H9IQC4_9PSEU|nr:enoyl-CoA hydratase-related protein [Amycolatopsis bartoniae]MBB2939666.1 enoyl-CoA hydratase/carnithine racemase [Amycolatopsis bartoniae]TVT06228.1 enoyl-CoA hydratase/isomerase family protein [Amycolatopsis bartoniae]GHF36661.1 crotonase [Amycolatopsis bartoniae]
MTTGEHPVTGPWETLDVTVDGPVATVELNRPDRLNALSPLMQQELHQVWLAYDADPQLRVAVVTGAGDRAFCSGADVSTVADTSRNRTSDYDRENNFTPVQAGIRKPTICAVNGVCAGAGLHFVSDCDFAIAADSATFLDPHVNVGQVSALEPIGLSRTVPLGHLMRMVLVGKGERITAERAEAIGLVTEVVPAADLRKRAAELAAMVAEGSPEAIAISRQAVLESLSLPHHEALRRGFVLLRAHADHHPDAQEGPRAFAERRPPRWQV